VQYTLTGSGQTLAVPFYFLAAADLVVLKTNAVTLADTTLVLNTDYTVSGAGAAVGGSITLSAGASGDIITIVRNGQVVQPVPFAYNGQFPSSTVEQVADRITMLVQQLREEVKRALRLPLSSAEQSELGAADRRDALVGFDLSGNVDLSLSLDALRTIVIANPVAALTEVTDYGTLSDPVTDVADYGTIA
jgi:hypothetical protein